jgi:hypothetical protein
MDEPELQPETDASPSNFVPGLPVTPPPSCAPLLHLTPVKLEISTTCPFTTNQKFRIESRTAMGKEIKKYLVGPMPAHQFLNEFFPASELSGLDAIPQFAPNCYSRTIKSKKEMKAYQHFVSPFD